MLGIIIKSPKESRIQSYIFKANESLATHLLKGLSRIGEDAAPTEHVLFELIEELFASKLTEVLNGKKTSCLYQKMLNMEDSKELDGRRCFIII